jgi:hypothetical protein
MDLNRATTMAIVSITVKEDDLLYKNRPVLWRMSTASASRHLYRKPAIFNDKCSKIIEMGARFSLVNGRSSIWTRQKRKMPRLRVNKTFS